MMSIYYLNIIILHGLITLKCNDETHANPINNTCIIIFQRQSTKNIQINFYIQEVWMSN